jgi:hypothetical protein
MFLSANQSPKLFIVAAKLAGSFLRINKTLYSDDAAVFVCGVSLVIVPPPPLVVCALSQTFPYNN